MVAQLDDIQRDDARLSRARNARKLREARDRAAVFEAEIASYQATFDQAVVNAKAAADADDSEQEGRNLLLARAYDELRYTRLATMQRAQDRLRELLAKGTLTLEDPLDDYALTDEDYEALDKRIRVFQEEYQQLFALCQRFEGIEQQEPQQKPQLKGRPT